MKSKIIYDVVIIGGGAAGLAAAMVLVRGNKTVLVIDAKGQSNLVSKKAHAVFSRDKINPAKLYTIAREQYLAYPTSAILFDTVLKIKQTNVFTFLLKTNITVKSRKLIFAQGVNYVVPEIAGLQELYGTKAWHCPFCDGFEATNKKLLAIYSRDAVAHMKKLLINWTTDIQFVLPTDVAHLGSTKAGVVAKLHNGSQLLIDQVITEITMQPRDYLANSLGCVRDKDGQIKVDESGKTSIKNVYAVGDQASNKPQVNVAVASGHTAGADIVAAE